MFTAIENQTSSSVAQGTENDASMQVRVFLKIKNMFE